MTVGDDLSDLARNIPTNELASLLSDLPETVASTLLAEMDRDSNTTIADSPAELATMLDESYRERDHLTYLSNRLARAVDDIEQGTSRRLVISMPPRSGKSTLTSLYLPTWLLARHPEWNVGMISHEDRFATLWGRQVRRLIEQHPELSVDLASDLGAASEWETTDGGGIISRSIGGSITGRGLSVAILDDLLKDSASAHSKTVRDDVWDRWLSTIMPRMEPPYLVVVLGTRWHEDDHIGRLLSDEHEGNPHLWENITFPALAESDDVLGRETGEPLYTPLTDETREQALERLGEIRESVGSYAWAALYQQRPAPARGAIFDMDWWRYWTHDPDRATEDGSVVYLDPSSLKGAAWCDSWDANFKAAGADEGSWVVGQRWAKFSANRYLISQKRGRWSFTETLHEIEQWAATDSPSSSPYGHLVHDRLIEERANGAAIIDTMREKISGLKPINPTQSKEARARAVTPEIESGNVFLPLPSEEGNEWVRDFLDEFRSFPSAPHDDQVDSLTQALSYLRTSGRGSITVPGSNGRGRGSWQRSRNVTRAAMSDQSRHSNGRVSRSR